MVNKMEQEKEELRKKMKELEKESEETKMKETQLEEMEGENSILKVEVGLLRKKMEERLEKREREINVMLNAPHILHVPLKLHTCVYMIKKIHTHIHLS